MAWTKNKLLSEMRKAGWQSVNHGGYYHSPTGTTVHIYNFVDGGEIWRKWAENETLPPLPEKIKTIRSNGWIFSIMSVDGDQYVQFERLPHRLNVQEAHNLGLALYEV